MPRIRINRRQTNTDTKGFPVRALIDEAVNLIDELVEENTALREENADLNAQLNLWLEEANA